MKKTIPNICVVAVIYADNSEGMQKIIDASQDAARKVGGMTVPAPQNPITEVCQGITSVMLSEALAQGVNPNDSQAIVVAPNVEAQQSSSSIGFDLPVIDHGDETVN